MLLRINVKSTSLRLCASARDNFFFVTEEIIYHGMKVLLSYSLEVKSPRYARNVLILF